MKFVLNMEIYGKAKIEIYDKGKLVRTILPKYEKRIEVFNMIYKNYIQSRKEK